MRAEKARRGRPEPVNWDNMNDPRARLRKKLGATRSRMERNAAIRGEPFEEAPPDLHEKIAKRLRELLERSQA